MEFLCIVQLLPYRTLQGERVPGLMTAAWKCAAARTGVLWFDP